MVLFQKKKKETAPSVCTLDYLETLKLKEGNTIDWDKNLNIPALQMARKEGLS